MIKIYLYFFSLISTFCDRRFSAFQSHDCLRSLSDLRLCSLIIRIDRYLTIVNFSSVSEASNFPFDLSIIGLLKQDARSRAELGSHQLDMQDSGLWDLSYHRFLAFFECLTELKISIHRQINI